MGEQLAVEVGMESFGPGRTRVEVSAAGGVRISNHHSGVARQAETTIAPAVAARLLQQARALRPDAQRSFRMPVPDEVCYEITLAEDGTPVVTARFWQGELRGNPHAHALITALQDIVGTATDGRILL
jgi:hypothetical protein